MARTTTTGDSETTMSMIRDILDTVENANATAEEDVSAIASALICMLGGLDMRATIPTGKLMEAGSNDGRFVVTVTVMDVSANDSDVVH